MTTCALIWVESGWVKSACQPGSTARRHPGGEGTGEGTTLLADPARGRLRLGIAIRPGE